MRLKEEFFRRASPPPSGKYEGLHLQPEECEKENTESPLEGGFINYPKASPKQGKGELEIRMTECKASRLNFHYSCSKWMQWKRLGSFPGAVGHVGAAHNS